MIIKIHELLDWIILSCAIHINLIFNAPNRHRRVYFFASPLDILQKVNKFRTFAFCKIKFTLL